MLRLLFILAGFTLINAQSNDVTIITKRIETIIIAIPNTLTNETLQSYADILNEAVNKINEAVAKSSSCKNPVVTDSGISEVVKNVIQAEDLVTVPPAPKDDRLEFAEAIAMRVYDNCGMFQGTSIKPESSPWIVIVRAIGSDMKRMGVLIHPLVTFTKYYGFEEGKTVVSEPRGGQRKLIGTIVSQGVKDYLLISDEPFTINKNLVPICIPSSMDFLTDCRFVTWRLPENRRDLVMVNTDIVLGEECNGGSTVCAHSHACIPGESAIHCSLPSSRRVFVGFPYVDNCNKSQVLTVAYPNLNWILEQGFT